MKRALIAIAVLGAGCGEDRAHEATGGAEVAKDEERVVPATLQGMDPDEALRQNLAELAVSQPLSGEMMAAARGQPVEVFIDSLLASDQFSDYAARWIILGAGLRAPNEAGLDLLKLRKVEGKTDASGKPIYQLLEPCEAKDAVSVAPWWDSANPILICPSAYLPENRIDPKTGWRCGSKNQTDELRNLAAQRSADHKPLDGKASYCGCGPSLAFCVLDDPMRGRVAQALEAEAVLTVAQIVRENRPLDEAFTMKETYRDSIADFFYQRTRMLAGEIPALPPIDNEPPRWRPRHEAWPGQHAGILTSTHLIHITDGARDRLRDMFSIAWCKGLGAHGATAKQVYALGVTDLRDGEGWQKLAAMPLCTDCHARLDYGMQFFLGYPSSYEGFFDAHDRVPKGKGPLFGDGIGDKRGEADLTAAGFASLLVSQPEFSRCIAGRVTRHVLGDSATPDDIDALEKLFVETRQVRPLMREALVRFARHWDDQSHPAIASEALPEPAGDGMGKGPVTASPELRKMIDAQCLDCHDDAATPERDFRAAGLDRWLVEDMLHRVAWGDMPRSNTIGKQERDQMVRLFIASLWPKGPDRDAAQKYYLGMRALPIHSANANHNVLANAVPTVSLEPVLDPSVIQFGPGFVSYIAGAAAQLCKDRQGADFDGCIDAYISPVRYVNRRLPWLSSGPAKP